MALGLVQALQRDRLRVVFAEPIARAEDDSGNTGLPTHFARTLLRVAAPEPISFAVAEERVRTGHLDALLEDVVALIDQVGAGVDVVVVEGLVPHPDLQIATELNVAMVRSLSASLIPVISGSYLEAHGSALLDLALREFAEGSEHPPVLAGVLINRLVSSKKETYPKELRVSGEGVVAVLAAVPAEPRLTAPRLADVVATLGLAVAYEGDLARGRVQEIVIAGRGVELSDGATHLLPIGDAEAVRAAWRQHARDVRRSLSEGYYQGWDMHPLQLATRYGAGYAFFLEALPLATTRLSSFLARASVPGVTAGAGAHDDAATGQALMNFFLRAWACGAITDDEALASGLTIGELAGRSFTNVLRDRKASAAE